MEENEDGGGSYYAHVTVRPPIPPPEPSGSGGISDYYLYIFGIAVIACLLLIINMMVVGCIWPRCLVQLIRRVSRRHWLDPPAAGNCSNSAEIPTSKYQEEGEGHRTECSVCLSAFADGEIFRQLPGCKHSFHAGCIDMWLHSHNNCPLCRTCVSAATAPPPATANPSGEVAGGEPPDLC